MNVLGSLEIFRRLPAVEVMFKSLLAPREDPTDAPDR